MPKKKDIAFKASTSVDNEEFILIDTAVDDDEGTTKTYFMTKEEEAALLEYRVNMFNRGKLPLVPIIDNDYNFFRIALREIKERLTPLFVVRKYPNGDNDSIPVSSFEKDEIEIVYD